VALVLTARFVPESRAAKARAVDPGGQLLVIVLLSSLTYAIIEGPASGWASAKILGLFAVCAAALVTLIRYESRRHEPLLDMRFFRSAPFSGAAVIAVSSFAALAGFLFLNTLYLQEVRGLSALQAGLYSLPMAAMTVVFGPLSGRLVASRGPRPSLVIAGVALTLSGLILTNVTAHTTMAWLLVAYVVFGFGFAVVNAPITNTAVSGMPREQAGVAAAVASTSRQIGQSLGVAVAGSVLASTLHGPMRYGFGPAGWWILAGYGLVVLVLGIITTGRWARGTAERTAERLTPSSVKVPVP